MKKNILNGEGTYGGSYHWAPMLGYRSSVVFLNNKGENFAFMFKDPNDHNVKIVTYCDSGKPVAFRNKGKDITVDNIASMIDGGLEVIEQPQNIAIVLEQFKGNATLDSALQAAVAIHNKNSNAMKVAVA